jgi:cobyrinic acid a,c-diamide synthase
VVCCSSKTVKLSGFERLCFIHAAYEAYKSNHDFVIVEGMRLKKPGDDTTLLNAKIASTFGLPVLMVTNARKAAGVGERRIVRWDKLEWEREIAFNVQISASIMRRHFVDILGSIIHRLPSTKRGDTVLRKHFEELKIPLLGAIPEHPVLKQIKAIY